MQSVLGARTLLRQIPSPTGGWNARDPLPEMQANDAVILENMIPGSGGVVLRGGTSTRSTSGPAAVNTLMRYFPASTTQKLFAVAGTGIYDVTSPGPFGTALVTGLSTSKWQSTNYGTPGGQFLVTASGYDQPRIYNGTAWSSMTINAATDYPYTLDATKLMAPFGFGNRLYFIERNSLRVWYMPLQSISAPGGVTTNDPTAAVNCIRVIDFSSLCTMGGSMVAMADWTSNGGEGPNDRAVLITSTGQTLVYQGYDPNSATGFTLVGVFRLPPPIGSRCVIRSGADLLILTETGAVPISGEIALTATQSGQPAITDKIRDAFRQAYLAAPSNFGWELNEYPKGALTIVNVPRTDGTTQQYVMNALTGSWCNFSSMNALTFCQFNDTLVFGTVDGRVVQYDVGNQDDFMAISAIILPAFSDFKLAGEKRFVLARPLYTGAVGYKPAIRLAIDYDTTRVSLAQSTVPASGTAWGSPWGSPWGKSQGASNQWQGLAGMAQTASVLMNVVSNNPFRFDHMDVQFEPGGAF